MFEAFGADRAMMLTMDGPAGRAARSGEHLAQHFAEVPLLLIGFGRTREGSGIYPAIWSAMLAARAEGIGATLTGVMGTFVADEVFPDLLACRRRMRVEYMRRGGRWATQPADGGSLRARRSTRSRPAITGTATARFTVPEPMWPEHRPAEVSVDSGRGSPAAYLTIRCRRAGPEGRRHSGEKRARKWRSSSVSTSRTP